MDYFASLYQLGLCCLHICLKLGICGLFCIPVPAGLVLSAYLPEVRYLWIILHLCASWACTVCIFARSRVSVDYFASLCQLGLYCLHICQKLGICGLFCISVSAGLVLFAYLPEVGYLWIIFASLCQLGLCCLHICQKSGICGLFCISVSAGLVLFAYLPEVGYLWIILHLCVSWACAVCIFARSRVSVDYFASLCQLGWYCLHICQKSGICGLFCISVSAGLVLSAYLPEVRYLWIILHLCVSWACAVCIFARSQVSVDFFASLCQLGLCCLHICQKSAGTGVGDMLSQTSGPSCSKPR